MMVARGVWTVDRLGPIAKTELDPRLQMELEEDKAKVLAAPYLVTQAKINEVAKRLLDKYAPQLTDEEQTEATNAMWAEYLASDRPLPFTHRCPVSLKDVDDFEDLKDTERSAVA